jgi:hypothetical protein
MENIRNIADKINEIMENLDFKELSDESNIGSEGNSYNISTYFEEDYTARYGNVSYSSEDEWMPGLELYDDEPTVFSSGASHNISNQHQVYVIIGETSKEFNDNNNPIINPQNLDRRAKYIDDGETEATVAARVTVWLTPTEWETIKAAINHDGVLPLDSSRNILMGYQYAIHWQGRRLPHERSEI